MEASASFPDAVGVYDFRFLKPIDTSRLDEIAESYETVLTIEDGSIKGGLYGAVCEYMESKGYGIKVQGIGIPDEFIFQAAQGEQRAYCGMDKEGIESFLKKLI